VSTTPAAAAAASGRSGIGPGTRVGLYALAAAVGLAVLSAAINAAVPRQHGPPSSSYATTPAGLAAYAELLSRSGHPVVQLRRAPATGLLEPDETVVMLDPDAVLGSQGRALAAFVAAGGHLVTGGSNANAFLTAILRPAPRWVDAPPGPAGPVAAAPETAGVAHVVTLGRGGWSRATGPAGLRAVLGRPGGAPLLLAGTRGRGRIDLLADASPLENRLLARADNARLGVNLAGGGRRRVVFVESVHGYGVARGLAALPGRWWWALGGLALAATAWVAGRWRRLGPPSARGRALPPARSAYLHAMTTILRRTGAQAEVAELARSAGRRLVARRAGLPAAADRDQRLEGARRLGLSDEQAEALAGEGPPAAGDLLTLGVALARLEGARAPALGPGDRP
jgi:hypothetical protein